MTYNALMGTLNPTHSVLTQVESNKIRSPNLTSLTLAKTRLPTVINIHNFALSQ